MIEWVIGTVEIMARVVMGIAFVAAAGMMTVISGIILFSFLGGIGYALLMVMPLKWAQYLPDPVARERQDIERMKHGG